jgi:uncharacterized Zn-binding protein involved in type VI secretion
VKIEGQAVAIKGASFGSMGDMASKGTGGGIVSSNAHGPTRFIAPGSMNVKIQGKNVQLLGDQMLNNCGPSGSPANAATMAGVLQGPVIAQADELGMLAEVQEICDTHCERKAAGNNSQNCIDSALFAKDTAAGYQRRIKSEVPYNMGTNPPSPYMSRSDPGRQTRNWRIPQSRRPDTVIVNNPSKPWLGDNIAAVVECKWGADAFGPGQERAYSRIAGGRNKMIVLDDGNCQCPDDGKPEPVPVPVPGRQPAAERRGSPQGGPSLQPVAAAVAALGIAAAAIAAVASAPVTAAAAAAVAVVGLLGFGASGPSGGGGDVI